jgi:uncharacterized protein YkwD
MTQIETRRPGRVLVSILLVFGFVFVPLMTSPAFAEAPEAETVFVQRINEARTQAGLAPLVVHVVLAGQAHSWSQKLRESSGPRLGGDCELSHNTALSTEVRLSWIKLGENVGCSSGDANMIHNAFMNSPEHRKNIMDPTFDSLGIGIVMSESTMFVTEVFMQTRAKPLKSLKGAKGPKTKTIIAALA